MNTGTRTDKLWALVPLSFLFDEHAVQRQDFEIAWGGAAVRHASPRHVWPPCLPGEKASSGRKRAHAGGTGNRFSETLSNCCPGQNDSTLGNCWAGPGPATEQQLIRLSRLPMSFRSFQAGDTGIGTRSVRNVGPIGFRVLRTAIVVSLRAIAEIGDRMEFPDGRSPARRFARIDGAILTRLAVLVVDHQLADYAHLVADHGIDLVDGPIRVKTLPVMRSHLDNNRGGMQRMRA